MGLQTNNGVEAMNPEVQKAMMASLLTSGLGWFNEIPFITSQTTKIQRHPSINRTILHGCLPFTQECIQMLAHY